MKAAGFNTADFEKQDGVFRIKNLSADRIKTGVLEVGGAVAGSTRVSLAKFFTTDATPALYAWIGDDRAGSGLVGAWFQRVLIGGTSPATAKIIADQFGNVAVPAGVISAGTLITGVQYSGTVNANQVNAGQFVGHRLLLDRTESDGSRYLMYWDYGFSAGYGSVVFTGVNVTKANTPASGLRATLIARGVLAFSPAYSSPGAYLVMYNGDPNGGHAGSWYGVCEVKDVFGSLACQMDGGAGRVTARHSFRTMDAWNTWRDGVSGIFYSSAGKQITVTNGLITYIQP
jgi:hypothetical protein